MESARMNPKTILRRDYLLKPAYGWTFTLPAVCCWGIRSSSPHDSEKYSNVAAYEYKERGDGDGRYP